MRSNVDDGTAAELFERHFIVYGNIVGRLLPEGTALNKEGAYIRITNLNGRNTWLK